MLMTVYSTGMRRAEMCQLKVEDIDSDRMLIHIRQGKGRRDRRAIESEIARDIAPVLAVDEAVESARNSSLLADWNFHVPAR